MDYGYGTAIIFILKEFFTGIFMTSSIKPRETTVRISPFEDVVDSFGNA